MQSPSVGKPNVRIMPRRVRVRVRVRIGEWTSNALSGGPPACWGGARQGPPVSVPDGIRSYHGGRYVGLTMTGLPIARELSIHRDQHRLLIRAMAETETSS